MIYFDILYLSKENAHDSFWHTISLAKIIREERQINKAYKKLLHTLLISEKRPHCYTYKFAKLSVFNMVNLVVQSIRSSRKYSNVQLVIFVGHNDAERARQDLGGMEPGVSIHHDNVTLK